MTRISPQSMRAGLSRLQAEMADPSAVRRRRRLDAFVASAGKSKDVRRPFAEAMR